MSDYTKDDADLVRRSVDYDRRDDGEANASIAKSESEKQQSYLEDEKTVEGDRTISVSKKEVDGAVVDGDGDGEIEDELVYPSGLKLALLTFGLCLVLFVVALDNTIIATAIPTITTVFNSLDDVGWYGSSYLLTTTSLQPSFGKVFTYFDIKWTYLAAIALFEVGSIVCAAATSSPMLIIGRAIAGAGASALFSGALTIIGFSVPLAKRPIYVACLSSMFGIASVVGPILGGALTDKASWRWCFWINLPFGGLAFTAVLLFFKPPKRPSLEKMKVIDKLKKIDFLGAFFLICAIVCLLLALQWGGSTFAWNSSRIIGLLVGAGLLIIVFVALQFKLGDEATIPPNLVLGNRSVWVGAVYSCLFSMGLYTHIFYLPFYFQAVKGTTAEGSGIRSIPYLVSITISSILVGGLITKFGYYVPFLWVGSAIFAVGSGMLFTLHVGSGAGKWIGYQVLTGLGAGAGVQVPFLAVQATLNTKLLPSGNAIVLFANTLGGAISISVAQNVFTNVLVKTIPKFTTGVDAHHIATSGATTLRSIVPADQLQGVLRAYAFAIDQAFILPIAVGCGALVVSFLMKWGSVKGKDIVMGAAA